MKTKTDVPILYYSEEIMMRGGAAGLTKLAIAVESPVPVGEFSEQGQAVLKALIAKSAADDLALARGGEPVSLPEYQSLLRRASDMLKQPATAMTSRETNE